MSSPLRSLIDCGTKLWLDSIDPELVETSRRLGATGATSNPVIVAGILESGRYDDQIIELAEKGLDDDAIAWEMTDRLVRAAQAVFARVWEDTDGDDGYVSFEVDPLLEDAELGLDHDERVKRYVELASRWAEGHTNRMIKVPATPAGLDALEEIAAAGVTLNVTLIFTADQYRAARDAVWRGAQRRANPDSLKSVYSIFVSRLDAYTAKHVPSLSEEAQGMVGIVNAQKIWAENEAFWADRGLARKQEIIFASTGTKNPKESPDRYVEALAGSDIQTNPPATNDAAEASRKTYTRTVDRLPPDAVLEEIEREVDTVAMHRVLMEEGIAKFADPHKALLRLIEEKRGSLAVR